LCDLQELTEVMRNGDSSLISDWKDPTAAGM